MNYKTYAGAGIFVVIIVAIIALLVAVGLFFLFRAIACWYFKINKLLKEQQQTNAYLERIAMAIERNASIPVSHNGAPMAQSAPIAQPAPVMQTPPVVQSAPFIQNAPEPAQPDIVVAPEVAEKTCAGCGVPLPADASFCTQCGTPTGN